MNPVLPTFRRARLTLATLLALFMGACATDAIARPFDWRSIPPPPGEVRDAMVAASGDALLIVGGTRQTESGRAESDVILLMPAARARQATWREAGKLSRPVAHGAAVSFGADVICVGGARGGEPVSDTRRLIIDPTTLVVREIELSPLPEPLQRPAATVVRETLYVAGSSALYSLKLGQPDARWETLPAWPGSPLAIACAVAQNAGDAHHVFLFGADGSGNPHAFGFDPARSGWRVLAAPPRPLVAPSATTSGQAHVLLVSDGVGLLYHTITNTWTALEGLPAGVGDAVATRLGASPAIVSAAGTFVATPPALRSRFRWPDYLALFGYPVVLIVLGILLRVKDETDDEYFRGGRRIPWWAAGLSLVATQVSAIGFMAIPAKTFATDWVYFAGIASWFVVVPIVTHKFIPMFQRLSVTTAYEYLETRYNYAMRVFASVMFIVIQVTRAAVVLYLPAIALSAVTGIDKIWCIAAMGAVTTVYTVLGGMQTVIWTDVLQAVTLLGGALLCVVLVILSVGGLGPFVSAAVDDGKLRLLGDDWSIAGPSLWVVFFGAVFARLAALTSDQNVVQRYQSTAGAREASRALWTDAAVSIPWAIIIFLLGTALYVFFKANPATLDPSMDIDQVVPLFIAVKVPTGLAGLIVAAIFAASLDGSMLAVATTFVNDIYGRIRPDAPQRRRVVWARVMTVVLGAFATSIGVLLAVSNVRSLWDFAIQISGLFAGALAGVFILGLFTRRVGSAAAFVGVFVSAVVMYVVESRGLVHVLFYAAVGVCVSVMVGIAASFILPPRRGRDDVPHAVGTSDRMLPATVAPPVVTQ